MPARGEAPLRRPKATVRLALVTSAAHGAAMVDFSDREDVKRWLEAIKPAKRADQVAVALASRASLRVLPLIGRQRQLFESGPNPRRILLSFREIAAAWLVARYPGSVAKYRNIFRVARESVGSFTDRSAADSFASVHAAFSAASAAVSYPHLSAQLTKAVSIHAATAVTAAHSAAEGFALHLADASAADATALIDMGRTSVSLTSERLWVNGAPDFVAISCTQLRTILAATNEGWEVWIDWYEARLAGDAGRPPNEALEIARAKIPDKIWKQGPAAVNAEIKRLIAENEVRVPHSDQANANEGSSARQPQAAKSVAEIMDALRRSLAAEPDPPAPLPEIPLPKPAALEPVFKAGRLTLPKTAAEATLPGETIPSAFKALAQSLAQLAEVASDESNIDRRIIKRLNEIAARIPRKRPSQTELFRLGHEFDELKDYSKIVAVSWPELVAARYAAMMLAFERTLRRFPKWVDFTREPPIGKLSAAQANDISEVAQTVSDILREPENQRVVDAVVPDMLDNISAPLADASRRAEERLDPIELGKELLAQDVLESINNTMKRVAEAALAAKGITSKATKVVGKKIGSYVKDFADAADESLQKVSKEAGEGVGPVVVRVIKGLLYTSVGFAGVANGPTLAAWLTAHYPQMYSWLEPLIGFLK